MKTSRKLRIFALVTAILTVLCTVTVCAAEKLDQNIHGQDLSFAERLEYALQGSITGILMVFSVLSLLWLIVYLSRVFLYDIPNRKKQKAEKKNSVLETNTAEIPSAAVEENRSEQNEGEITAVITAAIAAMIESGEYKNEFAGGFRVVSFKRSSEGAWNRK